MAEQIVKHFNRVIFSDITTHGLIDSAIKFHVYHPLIYSADLVVAFSNANFSLYNYDDDDDDGNIFVISISQEELRMKVQQHFGMYATEQVTVAMLETFCYSNLRKSTKSARK